MQVQAAVTLLGMLGLSLVLEHLPSARSLGEPAVVLAIVYSAVASAVLAFLLRILGQRNTPPQHVGFYVGLESVFAVIVGD